MKNMTKAELLNDIERLRIMLRGADARISENDKQIKRLQGDKTWLQQLEAEYRKEIKQLRADAVHDANELDEKSNEIKRLHQHIDDDEITIQNKQNEINNLRCDYDHRQAIITEMSKEIKDLKVALASAEKLNDSRKFHNATVAMGNPLYFQGV
mgnify:FL=1